MIPRPDFPTNTAKSIMAMLPLSAWTRIDYRLARFRAEVIEPLLEDDDPRPPSDFDPARRQARKELESIKVLSAKCFDLFAEEALAVATSVEQFESALRSEILEATCRKITSYSYEWLTISMHGEFQKGIEFLRGWKSPLGDLSVSRETREATWKGTGEVVAKALANAILLARMKGRIEVSQGNLVSHGIVVYPEQAEELVPQTKKIRAFERKALVKLDLKPKDVYTSAFPELNSNWKKQREIWDDWLEGDYIDGHPNDLAIRAAIKQLSH